MPLGTEGGLGPADIVLYGDPAPPKRTQPPIFDPCLLWPNGRRLSYCLALVKSLYIGNCCEIC